MFIKELNLYINYLKEQVDNAGQDEKCIQYCIKFSENLLEGINYYKSIGVSFKNSSFIMDLVTGENQIHSLTEGFQIKVS